MFSGPILDKAQGPLSGSRHGVDTCTDVDEIGPSHFEAVTQWNFLRLPPREVKRVTGDTLSGTSRWRETVRQGNLSQEVKASAVQSQWNRDFGRVRREHQRTDKAIEQGRVKGDTAERDL